MSSDITDFYSVIDDMVTTNQGNTTGPPVEHDCFSSKYLNSYCSLDYSTGKAICHVLEPNTMITREIPFIDEYFFNINDDENDEQDEDDQIFPHHFFLQTNQQTIVLLPLVKEHVFLGEKKIIGKLVVLLEQGLNRLVLTQQIVAKELEENNNNNQHDIDEDIDSFSVLWIGFNSKLRRIFDSGEHTTAAAYNYANRKYDAHLNSNDFHWQLGLCKNITKKKNCNDARILNFIPTQWG